MKIGTKSLLFGVHQFILHPLLTLWGWVILYGWSAEKYGLVWWKLLVCFAVHDWGYWDRSDIDGDEGVYHVSKGAYLAHKMDCYTDNRYYNLCLLHSRSFSQEILYNRIDRFGHPRLHQWGIEARQPSMLCWADKLGTAMMPTWLWVFLARLSGELNEYRNNPKYNSRDKSCPYKWFEDYKKTKPIIIKHANRIKIKRASYEMS